MIKYIKINSLERPKLIMNIKDELKKYTKPDNIQEKFAYFHKTGKGEYAENDIFIGVTVPDIRKVATKYYSVINLKETEALLHSKYHEERLLALIILTYKMEKAKESEQKEIVDLYISNTKYINGWDLVDMSAPYVLGKYLLEHKDEKNILYKFAESGDLWKQRISIVSTWAFIKNGYYKDTIKIAEILLNNEQDLIHKAVGWMLREVGKKDFEEEYNFLIKNYKNMPRTMLRYSIEKFDENLRQDFLKGRI